MLREYQDEIKRLKDQLDATQRGVIIGEDGRVINGKKSTFFFKSLLLDIHFLSC